MLTVIAIILAWLTCGMSIWLLMKIYYGASYITGEMIIDALQYSWAGPLWIIVIVFAVGWHFYEAFINSGWVDRFKKKKFKF